jgi:hypothetical protein
MNRNKRAQSLNKFNIHLILTSPIRRTDVRFSAVSTLPELEQKCRDNRQEKLRNQIEQHALECYGYACHHAHKQSELP